MYLLEEITKPDSTNTSALQRWSSENSIVIAWLINSMKPIIGKTYLFIVKEVWEGIRETYFDVEDSYRIFKLKTRLWQMKQGEKELTNYYMKMVTLWQELDMS